MNDKVKYIPNTLRPMGFYLQNTFGWFSFKFGTIRYEVLIRYVNFLLF